MRLSWVAPCVLTVAVAGVVPCDLTVVVASVLPCVLTVAVDTGQRYPPAVVGPFPLLSVESEREAPEPAVEGAAMGSAMAPIEREGVCFTSFWFKFCRLFFETSSNCIKTAERIRRN